MPRPNAPSYIANGPVAPSTFVKIDPSVPSKAVIQAGNGDLPVGISQEGMRDTPGLVGSDNTIAARAGDTLGVFGDGDDCLLTMGATCNAGAALKPGVLGVGMPCSTGDRVSAIAQQACTVIGAKILVIFTLAGGQAP